MGYHRAGFEVVGVDIKPQPRYPFEFEQADALAYMDWFCGDERTGDCCTGHMRFDAIHASPPCQAYSAAGNIWGRENVELIEPTRELLRATGLPYVIENVERAPLLDAVTICGLALGLNVKRHRLFEANFPIMVPPCTGHERDYLIVFGGSGRTRGHQHGRTAKGGPRIRRGTATREATNAAMGIDWMTGKEISEAIPPLYTELVGAALMQHLHASERDYEDAEWIGVNE
jgi:DNA (cytosine-5)-methyltransferase 1